MESGAVGVNDVAMQSFKNSGCEVNMVFHIELKTKLERALVQAKHHSLYLAHPVNFNDDKWVAYRFADEGCMMPSAISQGHMTFVQLRYRSFPNESLCPSHSKCTVTSTQPGQHQSHSPHK